MFDQNRGKGQLVEAKDLQEDVVQENIHWSAVYRISAGEVRIVVGENILTSIFWYSAINNSSKKTKCPGTDLR